MWARFFRASKIRAKKELRDARRSLSVNEEYLSTLRTKSYADFSTKAQLLINGSTSPSPSYCYHSSSLTTLLEPRQEATVAILESAILPQKPDLKAVMLEYFNISAEASKICSQLLKSIKQILSSYKFIQQALATIDNKHSPEQFKRLTPELKSFIILENPFSKPTKNDFKLIRERYSSVLRHLKSKRKKVARKMKLIRSFNKTCGVCITGACGLVAIAAFILAAHTLTALLMGPAIFGFPIKGFGKKLLDVQFLRYGFLARVGEQLDVAAKGTYILNRDFDTMSRLVARLYDEVEHNKAMIQFCLERKEDKFSLQEVMKELKKSDEGFRKQLEELEEHVYLCLVTINRARRLVIKEMTTSCCIENLEL